MEARKMLGLGPQEVLLIFLIIVLLFGASKLPELARSLGKAKGEFKKGMEEEEEKPKAELKAEEKKEK
ncbi:MAG: twin-arginine translocase TatA/TatE family subunit [Methanobacteriota archaeon]